MEKQVLFTNTLDSLLELALEKGNRLSKAEIHFYFKDQIEEEGQYDLIYRFLTEKGILVEGYSTENPPDNPEESCSCDMTEDEKAYLSYYKKDLEGIAALEETERVMLLEQLFEGDTKAMNRLIEGHLYLVMELLPLFQNSRVRIGDLIQEGNMGLIEGISSYVEGDFLSHIRESIRSAMEECTKNQRQSDSVSQHLLERIHLMDRASRKLAEDFGREPTKEELADYLHMDVEEVEAVLKHSIDALTVSVED